MNNTLKAALVGALAVIATLAPLSSAQAQASGPAACILSFSNLDAQVAFLGASRTVACQAALKGAGPTATVNYGAPAGNPACIVLYTPGDTSSVSDGAIVFDSGSGQAATLCGVYDTIGGLYVYDLDGQAWAPDLT